MIKKRTDNRFFQAKIARRTIAKAGHPRRKANALRFRLRHRRLSVADLALRLEIDLLTGRRRDFIHRLEKALKQVSLGCKVSGMIQ